MSSALSRRLIPVAKRYPRAAGVLFLSMGAYMAFDGVRNGRKYEPFPGGVEVVGQVVSVRDSPGERPRYTAQVAIEAGGAEPIIENVVIGRRYARHVQVGDLVPMIQARDASLRFVSKSSIEGQGLVTLAGETVTGLFFAAPPIALFGLWFILAGPKRWSTESP